ncbi:amino acid adenylation domain-containing protein [Pseudoramibacter alactolyticus]|uniref:amino acid adenylation domain-containing protein n=1 Tax=Pseudoramibacter alactolyticus TaxID=113287 RepID=UPI00248D5F1E|nr:amino acid adenylation domain-containing protein [Pseudoramibacter alactolyticus]
MTISNRSTYLKANPQRFRQSTFCELFKETVSLYPDKIAVKEGKRQLTYRELEAKTNCLAHALAEAGIASGEIVGIAAGQSICSVVAMIGIWKAGGAYTYIDYNYPEATKARIVSECQCRLVLDQSFYQNMDYTRDDPIDRSQRDGLAVLIYTSSTTASPKGVMIEHRNVMASIGNFGRFDLTDDDIYAIFPSFSFVASVFDLYAALCLGCTAVIIPRKVRRHIDALQAFYKEEAVTITFLPPHMAVKFQKIDDGQTKLRLLIVGSEMARNLKKASYRILNVYGSSELMAMIAAYEISDTRSAYPIGRLNNDIRGYVVDESGAPVPAGEAGELWLASEQVARGYLHNEEKTAAHFIRNPFSDEPAFRWLYKSGDIVRADSDGIYHYVCRKDNMVKIRGFRVEIDEVERQMRQYGGIGEVCVKSFTDSGGTNILCGYFEADTTLDVKAVKAFLNKKMPYYMVPTALFQVESLPRTPSGKIARRAIQAPAEINDHRLLKERY